MSFRFDRDKFFSGVRDWMGPMTPQQVDGLNFLIASIEQDSFLTHIEWPSYMLATVTVETAHTFQPIHEYGGHNYFVRRYGSQTAVGRELGNLTAEEGATFAGEGDVQLTGHNNYKKATAALREQYPDLVSRFEARTGKTFDLEHNPSEAGDPLIAYAVMSYGMRSGLFTGKSLASYTKAKGFDALNARRIINGMDNAVLIAADCKEWLSILNDALIDDTAIASTAETDSAESQVDLQSSPTPTVESSKPEAEVATISTADGDGEDQQQEPPAAGNTPVAGTSLLDKASAAGDKLSSYQSTWQKLNPANYLPSLPSSIETKISVLWKQVVLPLFSVLIAWITGHWWECAGVAILLVAFGTIEWMYSRYRNNPKGAVPPEMLGNGPIAAETPPASPSITVLQTNET